MSENQTSYRSIFNSTSLFGGVQVFIILTSIVRSKFVAVFLGPMGIGVFGLLNSTVLFISAISSFGLERSVVRDLAEANASGDSNKVAVVITVLKKLVWFTGLFGAVFSFALSGFLSELTFGNSDYSIGFKLLAVSLLLNQITAGEKAILRGLRKLKYIAKASLWGSILGLVVSIPFYYFVGISGIVPAMLVSSFAMFFVTIYFSKRLKIERSKVSRKELFAQGKNMLLLGLALSLGSMFVLGESYLVRLFIRSHGNIEDVGFYSAGFAILNSYFGVIFTALTTDYYPRLAAVADDNRKAVRLMNQQSEMTVLLISPLLVVFLVFINFFIIVLYSNEFIPINTMMLWAGLGIYFKAVSWSLGVIFISKGEVKILLFSEIVSTMVMLTANLIGYSYYGLEGLGFSFLFAYLYTYIQNFLIVKFRYEFVYSMDFLKVFFVHLVLGASALTIGMNLSGAWLYGLSTTIILSSIVFSINKVNKRIDIMSFLKRRFIK
ncbi:Membrane protein involved in the export of O-antigen and teichoic acid [Cyclobacterium xiamenense]|uniref:Membrane protein involved in the export of O-antigen and teichoic acid n=1 Tax=Cyclobacterium xiamenense TaxID=1297121 RepID=A0A1H6ZGP9_9BACT|nr:oligosaccharide flippase family protein [Cyclobacterium xiamenense]SEJ50687.1 Membrane protein involved in the export of O-antigen and teichoic acid [Cyclobacterium xiamenense]